MAVTAYWYPKAFISAFDEEIDWEADTITAQLHDGYTPDLGDDYQDDLDNELATGGGYTQGGVTLSGKTLGATSNVVTFDHTDPQWTSSGGGFTAEMMVTVDKTPGSSSTNPLLWWMDFGQEESASGGGTFTVQMDSDGAATVTTAAP